MVVEEEMGVVRVVEGNWKEQTHVRLLPHQQVSTKVVTYSLLFAFRRITNTTSNIQNK
jgi:hypothetical protein